MSGTAHQTLKATRRDVLGNSSKKLRKSGNILGVVYGHGLKESVPVIFAYNDFEKIARISGSTSVVEVVLDNKKIPTLIHQLQYHPVKDTYVHVDFLAVNLKQAVEAKVPLVITGVSRVVKEDGAVLNKTVEFVTVSALPDKIPHEIELDAAGIDTINDVLHISDVAQLLPEGVTVVDDLEMVVLSAAFIVDEPETTETPETQIGDTPTESTETTETNN
ncbi:MAG: hypothetical protein OHK0017_03290 [Patescibacteria group bacterium]